MIDDLLPVSFDSHKPQTSYDVYRRENTFITILVSDIDISNNTTFPFHHVLSPCISAIL